jgi:hypothetical protein
MIEVDGKHYSADEVEAAIRKASLLDTATAMVKEVVAENQRLDKIATDAVLQNEALKEALDLIGELGSNTEMAVVYKIVDKALGRVTENRVESCESPECGNCGGDLVQKTEPAWICPKCEL